MPLSDQDLRHIVAKSSTLYERIEGDFIFDPSNVDSIDLQRRILRWKKVASNDDHDLYRNRLLWEGMNETSISRLLGSVSLPDHAPFPHWIDILNTVSELTKTVPLNLLFDSDEANYVFIYADQPLPFEHFFIPFIHAGRQQVIKRCISTYHRLTPEAHSALERALLVLLARLSKQTLNLDFSVFRLEADFDTGFDMWLEETETDDSTILYQKFIHKLLTEDGITHFFVAYPVLARIIATLIDQWIDSVVEFMNRLNEDHDAIKSIFHSGHEPGDVIAIEPALSDPHGQGRTVFSLQFSSGLKLIYKPKDVGMEWAYNQFLAWFNKLGITESFKIMKIIRRPSYGWVENIEKTPCNSIEEVQTFYRRAGRLLMALYALEATDVHFENIIACGDHPMLIDMETLLQPEISVHISRQDKNADEAAKDLLLRSVLKTGMLPRWTIGPEGKAFDISGLGFTDDQESAFRYTAWMHINSDRVQTRYEYVSMKYRGNVPVLDNQVHSFQSYLPEVISGFVEMYQHFLDHKALILGSDGPLSFFKGLSQRHVHRHTRIYALLQEKGLNPDFLHDGIDRSIELDALAFSLTQDGRALHPLLREEHQALERLDIPFFSFMSDQINLCHPHISNFFMRTGLDQVRKRIDQLKQQDMIRQSAIIRSTYVARFAEHAPRMISISDEDERFQDITPLTSEEKVNYAVAIAEKVKSLAIQIDNGDVTWIGFQYLPEAGRFQHGPIGQSLYSGEVGIALFFAALGKFTDEPSYKQYSKDILQPFQRDLENPTKQKSAGIYRSIGAGVGLGGMIYAFLKIGEMFDDSKFYEMAEVAVQYIDDEKIGKDRVFDLMSGAAGAILSLLCLYRKTNKASVLEVAVKCGRHLLENRIHTNSRYQVWRTIPDIPPLTGFAHGTAGIAYALIRLYQETGERRFLEAANTGIAYEKSVFLQDEGNWPDFRKKSIHEDGTSGCLVQWCHGAPGIALARLGGIAELDSDEIRKDVHIALDTTCKARATALDHLCCGSFGRVDILMEAARILQRPDLKDDAERIAALVMTRSDATGYFRLFDDWTQNIYNPGLFQGTVGIGYELLRMTNPDEIPSVLLWQ